LAGKRVLDVGCNEGFFSVQMGRRGGHVLGIDIDSHRIDKARFVQPFVAADLDLQFEKMDIYSTRFQELPRFDVCLCLGFIHRVPDPYRAIAAIAERVDTIIFEWKALKFGHHDEAFAYFSPKPIDADDYYGTEFWLLSYAALERILRRLGFGHFRSSGGTRYEYCCHTASASRAH
jgi:SAM-dependent methyltransferase